MVHVRAHTADEKTKRKKKTTNVKRTKKNALSFGEKISSPFAFYRRQLRLLRRRWYLTPVLLCRGKMFSENISFTDVPADGENTVVVFYYWIIAIILLLVNRCIRLNPMTSDRGRVQQNPTRRGRWGLQDTSTPNNLYIFLLFRKSQYFDWN